MEKRIKKYKELTWIIQSSKLILFERYIHFEARVRAHTHTENAIYVVFFHKILAEVVVELHIASQRTVIVCLDVIWFAVKKVAENCSSYAANMHNIHNNSENMPYAFHNFLNELNVIITSVLIFLFLLFGPGRFLSSIILFFLALIHRIHDSFTDKTICMQFTYLIFAVNLFRV